MDCAETHHRGAPWYGRRHETQAHRGRAHRFGRRDRPIRLCRRCEPPPSPDQHGASNWVLVDSTRAGQRGSRLAHGRCAVDRPRRDDSLPKSLGATWWTLRGHAAGPAYRAQDPIKPGESFSYTGPAHVYADRTLSAAGQTPLKITGRWLLVHRHPTDVAVPKGSFSSTACAAPRRSFTAYRGAPLRP